MDGETQARYWHVLVSRVPMNDEMFYYAVRTTGIYSMRRNSARAVCANGSNMTSRSPRQSMTLALRQVVGLTKMLRCVLV
ncbi:MAG: hypothetical protein EOM24_07230 [Chloroflexia bacterium]|nr:hypothetical protein [Chloroflexia bacterium]